MTRAHDCRPEDATFLRTYDARYVLVRPSGGAWGTSLSSLGILASPIREAADFFSSKPAPRLETCGADAS